LIHFYKSIFRFVDWTIAWGRASKMGDQQKDERIPKGSEVEELAEVLEEEGETLSMRFLALAVSHNTVPSSEDRQRHSELTRRRSRSLEESLATIKRKKTWRSRKSVLRRSKLGESLMKMQQKTSLPTEVTSSKIIEETTTSPPESAKIFGRKFSASLENFATLSLRETRVEEGEEVNETETFRASNKRKREETPFQEGPLQPLACGAQARRGLEDVTADDLAGYLEDTTFFPKRMSCMAEMMYT
jgi:tryptophanyl-tRNA synthetase